MNSVSSAAIPAQKPILEMFDIAMNENAEVHIYSAFKNVGLEPIINIINNK